MSGTVAGVRVSVGGTCGKYEGTIACRDPLADEWAVAS
jgi:hypothetical protein